MNDKERLQNEEETIKISIKNFKSVIEIGEKQLEIISELKEIDDNGERAIELGIEYWKLNTELNKIFLKGAVKIAKIMKERRDDFAPDLYR